MTEGLKKCSAEAIARRLHASSDKLGISQADVARELCVGRMRVNHWYSGQSRPKLEDALKLSRLLKIPVATLLFGRDSPKHANFTLEESVTDERVERAGVTNELLLENVKAIQSKLSQHDLDFIEIKSRLGGMESQYASLSNRFDRLDERVRRIEARLDLIDA